jgi:hypothetical protein
MFGTAEAVPLRRAGGGSKLVDHFAVEERGASAYDTADHTSEQGAQNGSATAGGALFRVGAGSAQGCACAGADGAAYHAVEGVAVPKADFADNSPLEPVDHAAHPDGDRLDGIADEFSLGGGHQDAANAPARFHENHRAGLEALDGFPTAGARLGGRGGGEQNKDDGGAEKGKLVIREADIQ